MTGLRQRMMDIAVLALCVVTIVAAWFAPGRPYPACDNSTARAALAVLYDNRRLLHADGVSDLHLLRDRWSGRYCVATIRWSNGTTSDVQYEFSRPGRRYSNDPNYKVTIWIDYNGGFRGPAL